MTVKAREIVLEAGYTDPFLDSAHGFAYDWDYLRHAREQDPSIRWRGLAEERTTPVYFWYRQSPRYLTPTGFNSSRSGGRAKHGSSYSSGGSSVRIFNPHCHYAENEGRLPDLARDLSALLQTLMSS